MDGFAVEETRVHLECSRVYGKRRGSERCDWFWTLVIMGSDAQKLFIWLTDVTPRRTPITARAFAAMRIENRLERRSASGDDAQDLAGRSLLLQGFGEIAVARLEFLEQAHVLDGDDGLVGEGLSAARSACR